MIPIVTLGLPLADMIYAVLRRWSRGLPIKEADREHIHHKLLEMGLSQRPTVLLLYGVNIFLVALAGILILVTRNSLAALIVVFLGLALILGSRLLGYFRFFPPAGSCSPGPAKLPTGPLYFFSDPANRPQFGQSVDLGGTLGSGPRIICRLGIHPGGLPIRKFLPSSPDLGFSRSSRAFFRRRGNLGFQAHR